MTVENMGSTCELPYHLRRVAAKDLLHHVLSIGSHYSSQSPSNEEAIVFEATERPCEFRIIGFGRCGTVFEIPGFCEVVKRAHRGIGVVLWKESMVHRQVVESFASKSHLLGTLQVPRCYSFIRSGSRDFWRNYASLFPKEYQEPSALYFTERIIPLNQMVRSALTELYMPAEEQPETRRDGDSQDCLIRLYLGKRIGCGGSQSHPINFRDFALHLDQIEELNLDAEVFAVQMASALALMHWHTCIDASGVEFVLGSTRTEDHRFHSSAAVKDFKAPATSSPLVRKNHFHERTIGMWLLDFDRCSEINVRHIKDTRSRYSDENAAISASQKTKGVRMAVTAFLNSDPYFPKPNSSEPNEQRLWQVFRNAYISTGCEILKEEEDTTTELPSLFIRTIEQIIKPEIARIKTIKAEKALWVRQERKMRGSGLEEVVKGELQGKSLEMAEQREQAERRAGL